MLLAGLIKQRINPHYEELFAKGVDPNLPEHLDKHSLWPNLDEVRAYRNAVKTVIEDCIDQQNYPFSVNANNPMWAVLMGIEHDRIHFETSSVLIRQLPVNDLQSPIGWQYAPNIGHPPANQVIQVDGGLAKIGKPEDSTLFGWDNEYGRLEKTVQPFEANQNLISNEEYLKFYQSAHYTDRKYWSTEGWDWKLRTETQHPKFWIKTDDGFDYRAMFDQQSMPLDYPVEVNAHEACAFINWKGENWRLLSEAEFNIIAHNTIKEDDSAFHKDFNLNMKYGSPTPVGSLKSASSELGFNDLFGNVWDWLMDDFAPLPGFKTHPLYTDFSQPYFDNQHALLLGGSWATTGTGTSKYYRLWFRRHFYQHAAFRLARSL